MAEGSVLETQTLVRTAFQTGQLPCTVYPPYNWRKGEVLIPKVLPSIRFRGDPDALVRLPFHNTDRVAAFLWSRFPHSPIRVQPAVILMAEE